jgi:hypothetical protein
VLVSYTTIYRILLEKKIKNSFLETIEKLLEQLPSVNKLIYPKTGAF